MSDKIDFVSLDRVPADRYDYVRDSFGRAPHIGGCKPRPWPRFGFEHSRFLSVKGAPRSKCAIWRDTQVVEGSALEMR